jgi:FkbM family methyltransferase
MKQIIKFILHHPLGSRKPFKAVFRFLYWQIIYRIFKKSQLIFSVTEKTKMILKPGLTGASGNYYCGLLEFQDKAFCLHFLRPEDTFFDVGANVGIYTLLASGHVGCQTISFEPDKQTINHLKENVAINQITSKVTIQEKVIGESNGIVKFSIAKDTVNHVVSNDDANVLFQELEMSRLDDYKSAKPKMIKIDVEGFEWGVLNGAEQLLSDSNLEVILIEINGSGAYFGVEDYKLHDLLIGNGFEPYSYNPFERKLTQLQTFGNLNTIYIRNKDHVEERLINARSFNSFGISI